MSGPIAVSIISLASILCMLIRPRRIHEAYWVCAGALLLILTRRISLGDAAHAVREGLDVYLFLAGMMLLSELARREGVFEWLADLATHGARGSARRLFLLIYGVGVLVTVFLSNDATAVVLTPAVYAAVKRAQAKPLPYLLACALIANAASFVLPISNPANLVIFGSRMPPLWTWIKTFGLPSLLAIGITFGMMSWLFRNSLSSRLPGNPQGRVLSSAGKLAGLGLIFAATVLILASANGVGLGVPTCLAAIMALLIVLPQDRAAPIPVLRHISWSVLPLVAGLFVIVEALSRVGALGLLHHALLTCSALPFVSGKIAAAFGTALASNVMNNLPVGLAGGWAIQGGAIPSHIAHSVLIGVDLGPNLSVTGSLATLLWLSALRREGIHISGWEFMKVGLWVMPISLLAGVLFLL